MCKIQTYVSICLESCIGISSSISIVRLIRGIVSDVCISTNTQIVNLSIDSNFHLMYRLINGLLATTDADHSFKSVNHYLSMHIA